MNNDLTILLVLFYIAVLVINVVLIVKFWKAANAALETRNQVRDLSFRDTARYLSEVRRGIITDEDQSEAKKAFGIE